MFETAVNLQLPLGHNPYCSAADTFILNTRLPEHNVEGFGFVFFEALTHNVPVIGGNSGGIPEAIINNKTGLLVNPMDEAKIADTITKLKKN